MTSLLEECKELGLTKMVTLPDGEKKEVVDTEALFLYLLNT